MRFWFLFVAVFLFLSVVAESTETKDDQQSSLEPATSGGGSRLERAAKGRKNKAKTVECRYKKGQWSECSPQTNQKTRTLTLKRANNEEECESTKVETKKCKKMCRYQKGQWSECNASSHQMERIDTLKPGNDPSCESTKRLTKKCREKAPRKSGKKSRNN